MLRRSQNICAAGDRCLCWAWVGKGRILPSRGSIMKLCSGGPRLRRVWVRPNQVDGACCNNTRATNYKTNMGGHPSSGQQQPDAKCGRRPALKPPVNRPVSGHRVLRLGLNRVSYGRAFGHASRTWVYGALGTEIVRFCHGCTAPPPSQPALPNPPRRRAPPCPAAPAGNPGFGFENYIHGWLPMQFSI